MKKQGMDLIAKVGERMTAIAEGFDKDDAEQIGMHFALVSMADMLAAALVLAGREASLGAGVVLNEGYLLRKVGERLTAMAEGFDKDDAEQIGMHFALVSMADMLATVAEQEAR